MDGLRLISLRLVLVFLMNRDDKMTISGSLGPSGRECMCWGFFFFFFYK